jgi:bacillithiol synthase
VSSDVSTGAAASSPARLGVDVRRFPWVRPLAGEYAFNFSTVAPLYAGDPRSTDAWHETRDRVLAHTHNRDAIAEVIAAQQARRGAPPESRAAAARLADPQAVAVVTGQQAGAFGGPLFTILKTITSLQLARRAERTLGGPVVPVFWVDAEDHDWDEIASATILDSQYQPRTVTLAAPEGADQQPIAALRLDDRVLETLSACEATLTPTEFTSWVMETLRRSYRPGAGMADAFATWLESVLGSHGIVVFDSSDPAVKPLVADVFRHEITSPGETAARAARAGDALAARGHAPQVQPQPDSVSLFRLDGGRKPIRRQSDEFIAGDDTFSADALAAEAASRPDRFSPNVLLRPIVQDTLFPTVCYVAGPSELAYLGQLRDVYAHFGRPMPLIHPRATATIVDSATVRFLQKYDVPLEDLQAQDESALNRLLQTQLPPSVDSSIAEADDAMRRVLERVEEAIAAVDPTLVGAVKTTRNKIEHELRTLRGKVIQAMKKRDETLRRQFTRAQALTFPQGHPQERALAVVYFLNLYGPALIDRLLEELPTDLGQHWVLTI